MSEMPGFPGSYLDVEKRWATVNRHSNSLILSEPRIIVTRGLQLDPVYRTLGVDDHGFCSNVIRECRVNI